MEMEFESRYEINRTVEFIISKSFTRIALQVTKNSSEFEFAFIHFSVLGIDKAQLFRFCDSSQMNC